MASDYELKEGMAKASTQGASQLTNRTRMNIGSSSFAPGSLRSSVTRRRAPLNVGASGPNYEAKLQSAVGDASNLRDLGAMVRGRRAIEAYAPLAEQQVSNKAAGRKGLREVMARKDSVQTKLSSDLGLMNKLFGDI